MKEKHEKKGDYIVSSIPNPNGKNIEEVLKEICISYCTDKIQEQMG